MLFVHGLTHEPPLTEKATIGSYTLFSIDTQKGTLDNISWTHDIRDPNTERYLEKRGQFDGKTIKIDKAFETGGFSLMQNVVEPATDLPIDFQLAFSDEIIIQLIDGVTGAITVNNPKKLNVYPIYTKDGKHPSRVYEKGLLNMKGIETLQYIKSVPVEDIDPVLEHNQRKHRVLKVVKEKINGIFTYLKLAGYLNQKVADGSIALDFDLGSFIYDPEGLGRLSYQLGDSLFRNCDFQNTYPKQVKRFILLILLTAMEESSVQLPTKLSTK